MRKPSTTRTRTIAAGRSAPWRITTMMANTTLLMIAAAAWLTTSAHSAAQALPEADWRPIFTGVELTELAVDGDRPMRGAAVRVDLRAPGIRVVTTPDNGDKEGETDALRTSTFLQRTRSQVAVNAAPFSPIQAAEGTPQDVSGLHVSEGVVVSKPHWAPSLDISDANVARIVRKSRQGKDYWNAVAGFRVVLWQGEIVARDVPDVHPRTAAGVAEGGRRLILLVIDGRQRGHSVGATEEEVGLWLRHLGAEDGINFDGGGTTTLVVAQPDGSPRLVNRPIHAGMPGLERIAGSHLGIQAQPLPDAASGAADPSSTQHPEEPGAAESPAASPEPTGAAASEPRAATLGGFLRRVFGGG